MKQARLTSITSRALAALPTALRPGRTVLWRPKLAAILHKGREHVEELDESRLAWDFDVLLTNSVTDDGGVLLRAQQFDD